MSPRYLCTLHRHCSWTFVKHTRQHLKNKNKIWFVSVTVPSESPLNYIHTEWVRQSWFHWSLLKRIFLNTSCLWKLSQPGVSIQVNLIYLSPLKQFILEEKERRAIGRRQIKNKRVIRVFSSHDGNGQENFTTQFLSGTMAVHVRYKSVYIYIWLSSVNNSMKLPRSRYFGKREPAQYIFRISFWNWMLFLLVI